MSSSSERAIRLRDGAVSWREVDGESILLDLTTSTYLGVNPSGTVLWLALAAGATHRELAARLTARYGISDGQASGDVDAFLADCRERNLLET